MVAGAEKMSTISGTSVISDDLLIEILTKLPLKSLLRFKCVSKAWHQLISEDCIQMRQPLIISGVFYLTGPKNNREPRYGSTVDGGFSGCDLSSFPFHENSILVDSCNGLLLFYSYHPARLFVCNPMTKNWVAVLPKPGKRAQLYVLAFDPYRSAHYKVISFTGWRAQGFDLEVFSSETGTWVEREVQLGVDTDAMSTTISYFDGSLHILARPQCVVGIDLDRMRCRRIELPEPSKQEGFIGKSGGCLYYTNVDGDGVRIWMLHDNCKWVLKHSIRVHNSQSQRCGFFALHPEIEVAYFWVPGKIVSYDLRDKRLRVVCELLEEMESAYFVKISLFPFSRFMSNCLTNLG